MTANSPKTQNKRRLMTLCLTSAACIAAFAGASLITTSAVAAPEPAPIPERWELDIEHEALRTITVTDEQTGEAPYFYMIYEVTNNSGEDVYFAPTFEMYTDDGVLARSGTGVSTAVTDAVLDHVNDPLLLSELDAQGQLLQGDEHTRKSVVIWAADNLTVDQIKIFFQGFSGESRVVTNPDTDEESRLLKTYMVVYNTPGEIAPDSDDPIEVVEERWVMR